MQWNASGGAGWGRVTAVGLIVCSLALAARPPARVARHSRPAAAAAVRLARQNVAPPTPPPVTSEPVQTPPAMQSALATFQHEVAAWQHQEQRRERGWGLIRQFHGTLYEYFRNDALDAVPHEIHQGGGRQAALHRNQFGMTITGPLPIGPPRQRTAHISFSVEGTRESIAHAFLGTVPTLAERSGDFSDLVDASGHEVTIYDPATTRPNANYNPQQPVSASNPQYLRDPFPGNRIPLSRLDPVARAAMAYFPAPNTNVGPFLTNNYFSSAAERNTPTGGILHLDEQLTASHQVNLQLEDSSGIHQTPIVFPNPASPAGQAVQFVQRQAAVSDRLAFNDHTINSVHVNLAETLSRYQQAAGVNEPQALGLAGVSGTAFPAFSFSGAALSLGQLNPSLEDDWHSFGFADNLSLTRDKHIVQLGVRTYQSTRDSLQALAPSGWFSFSGGQTSLPGINDTGSPVAEFLLGRVSWARQDTVPGSFNYHSGIVLFDAQDQWPLWPALEMTVGVTFKIAEPRTERLNRQSSLDLNATNPVTGTPGAVRFATADSPLQPTSYVWQPHAGLAWQMNGRNAPPMVLRASYNLHYQDPELPTQTFGSMGFTQQREFTSDNSQLDPALLLATGVPPSTEPLPDLNPAVANNTTVSYLDRSDLLPMDQNWSLRLERDLNDSIQVQAAYEGAHGTHQWTWNGTDLNGLPPSALRYGDQLYDRNFNQSLRRFPQFLGVQLAGDYAYGSYSINALSLAIEDRFTHGLAFDVNYRFGKQIDNDSTYRGVQDITNLAAERSLSGYDHSQELTANFTYQLPSLPDSSASGTSLSHTLGKWAADAFDGWSASGFLTFENGAPLQLIPMFNRTGGVADGLRVNVVPGIDATVPHPSANAWFNPAAFAQPADYTLGNASRTSPVLRAPGIRAGDLSLNRDLAVGENRTLQLFLEAYNAFNHANLNEPDTVIGPASSPNLHAGKITGSTGGRVLQLGLRLAF